LVDLKGLFKKPLIELEKGGRTPVAEATVGDSLEHGRTCPACQRKISESDLSDMYYACPCGHHFRMNARQRIDFICDEGTFDEMFSDLESSDIINFPGYDKKLRDAKLGSGEKEAVICGSAAIGGNKCAVFVMESQFMMGSMGTVVGEKITRLFEYATKEGLPVVGFTVSGGARMQEGILSLMQMAKTSGAVKLHSDAGNFYLTVLTDPTTGGVTASFAMLGDIIMAEPGATVGFAGARVIEQTIRKKLPQGFQTAEFLLEHGFIDIICERAKQKKTIATLLSMHKKGGAN